PRYNLVETDLTVRPTSNYVASETKPVAVAKTQPKVASKPVTVAKTQPKVASKPVGVAKTQPKVASKPVAVAKTQPKVASKPVGGAKENSFEVYKGETYKSALVRWVRAKGYKGVAWAATPSTTKALMQVSKENEVLDGDVGQLIANKLSLDFEIVLDEKTHYAAIHEWKGYKVKVVEINGDTLEEVMRNLVTDFGWNWNNKKSWRTKKKLHGFSIPFPVVAPAHDIAMVLNQVLKDRPVRSEYHEETQTVFIIDDK
ncbi:hypothetical protein, partial [Vibrio tubiashii]